jgi:hypothetical protein
MPVTEAERQRRYRERHRDGLAHLTFEVTLAVRDLDRLAGTIAAPKLGKLAQAAERSVEAKLSAGALKAYRAGYDDTAR